MSFVSSSKNVDSWGTPVATSSSVQRHPPRPVESVRDDWDEDDDEEASGEREDPHQLWEEANKKAPMPELVISGSSTSSNAALSPPPAAIQPVLRILKRPTATATASSTSIPSSSSVNSTGSYAEREARYQAARERIFGDTSPSPSNTDVSTGSKPGTPKPPQSPPTIQIIREPKGPSPTPSLPSSASRDQKSESKGFGNRRGKRRGGKP